MKIGIMQPYFMPYIGYWQLIKEVDLYVIFDDVNYIKKGGLIEIIFLFMTRGICLPYHCKEQVKIS